jgi:hypothetical protein
MISALERISRRVVATHAGHRTQASAAAAARAAGAPNTQASAYRRESDGRWVPVVVLRPDQTWMFRRTLERGVAVVIDQTLPAPAQEAPA